MTPAEAIERLRAAGYSDRWIATQLTIDLRKLRAIANGTGGGDWALGQSIIRLAVEEKAA